MLKLINCIKTTHLLHTTGELAVVNGHDNGVVATERHLQSRHDAEGLVLPMEAEDVLVTGVHQVKVAAVNAWKRKG